MNVMNAVKAAWSRTLRRELDTLRERAEGKLPGGFLPRASRYVVEIIDPIVQNKVTAMKPGATGQRHWPTKTGSCSSRLNVASPQWRRLRPILRMQDKGL